MKTGASSFGRVSVALVVGALLLGSCTTNQTSQNASGTAVTSSAIKPYGSLTIAVKRMTGNNMDPYSADFGSFVVAGMAVFDSLVYYDTKNQLQPGIAERWEISPDGKTQTFYIRKGVKFHNGDDLTGADVKFSIDRALSPDNTAPAAPIWRAVVASVELKDEYAVALHLKAPQFEFLRFIDSLMGAVVPKSYIEKNGVDYFRQHPVGSGPWRVVSIRPGTRVELEAVESHWRAVPKFKNITLLNVTEEAAKVAMLKTGELDLAVVAPDSVSGLKSAGLGVDHWSGGTEVHAALFFDPENPDKYAFGDVRVRKAMQLGLNNQEIIDKLLGGFGERYVTRGVDPNGYYFDPNVLKVDPYDPEQAKKLLAEAGYAAGFTTRIYDIGGGDMVSTIVQAAAGYWRKIGVSSDIVPHDLGSFIGKYKPKVVPEIWNSLYIIWSGAATRQFEKMPDLDSTKGAYRSVKTPRLDELLDKVPTVADPVEKKKLALEAAVLAHNTYATLALVVPDVVVAHSPKVSDMAHFPISDIPALALETITHAK